MVLRTSMFYLLKGDYELKSVNLRLSGALGKLSHGHRRSWHGAYIMRSQGWLVENEGIEKSMVTCLFMF